jgi:hypothetical protein
VFVILSQNYPSRQSFENPDYRVILERMVLTRTLPITGFIARIFLLSLLLGAPAAEAGVRASFVGVGLLPMPKVTGAAFADSAGGTYAFPQPKGQWGFGGGLLIEAPISSRVGIEIGAQYFQRRFDADLTSVVGSSYVEHYTYSMLEVPLTLAIHLGRFFQVSLGGYATTPIGKGWQTTTPETATGRVKMSDLQLRNFSYGVLGGLGLTVPLGKKAGLRAEGRYHYALQNDYTPGAVAETPGASWKDQEVQVLVGLTIGGNAPSRGGGGKYRRY